MWDDGPFWSGIPEQLVVLGQTLGSARGASLDLRKERRGRVFRFGPATASPQMKAEATCPVQRPTTRSAMKVSSVSPERWLTITPQPLLWAILQLEGRHAQSLTGLLTGQTPD